MLGMKTGAEKDPQLPGANERDDRDPTPSGNPERRYDRDPNLSPTSPADEQEDDDPARAHEAPDAQVKDEAPAVAGPPGVDEGADDSDAGDEKIDFGRAVPPIFQKGAWFKVEKYRNPDFRCKAFDEPAPHGTKNYQRYRSGEAFGPVIACRHTQAHRLGIPFAFVTAHVRLGGQGAWINAWCNRNKDGHRQLTVYARPTDPLGPKDPPGPRCAAAAVAVSSRPAGDAVPWAPWSVVAKREGIESEEQGARAARGPDGGSTDPSWKAADDGAPALGVPGDAKSEEEAAGGQHQSPGCSAEGRG